MDFYQSLGHLILGSRLRRMSEYYLSEVNKVYQQRGIDFEASWFPVFYILSDEGPVSIKQLAERLQVSHSAMSQLVGNLKKRGLLQSQIDKKDGRQLLIRFTPTGESLLQEIKPVWQAISNSLLQLEQGNKTISALLPALAALENEFALTTLSERINQIEKPLYE